jgi:hypothetical protein
VKLTVGDWSSTERFEVRIDPRVAADGVTQSVMAEQLGLCLKVRDTISRARMAHDILGKARRERPNDEKLAALEAKFVTAPGTYMTPMLLDQLSYLNSMLDRADQKPGRDAYIRHEELSGLLIEYITELQKILE